MNAARPPDVWRGGATGAAACGARRRMDGRAPALAGDGSGMAAGARGLWSAPPWPALAADRYSMEPLLWLSPTLLSKIVM
jgi:hypothetical protein